MTEPLTETERSELLGLARACVLSQSTATAPPELPALTGRLGEPGGVFVTVRLGGDLRGCIGVTMSKFPLAEVVREMAGRAASRDPRFPPLSAAEAVRDDLIIEISVLSPTTALSCVLPHSVKIGDHGLVVSGRGRRGLLLPQVASDRGWSSQEFLDQTCVKAGLPPDSWRSTDVAVEVFTAEVF
jgi:AmmeMemoRadiSam system protein A